MKFFIKRTNIISRNLVAPGGMWITTRRKYAALHLKYVSVLGCFP